MARSWWVASLLAVGTVLGAQVPAPQALGLSLGGRVRDAATQQPVAGAAVTIRGTAPLPDPPTMVADAEGRFRFDRLRPGTYVLAATALGYLTGSGEHSDQMPPAEVNVTLDADTPQTDLQLLLVRPASIAGVVLDSDNAPVESAAMAAFREVYVAGVRRFAVGSLTGSDDAGQFRFSSLAPGRYIVCATGERLTIPMAAQAYVDRAATSNPQEQMAISLLFR